MLYEIMSGPDGASDYTPYGIVREFMAYKGSEAIISGPAETGKTLGALWKLHLCACKYPGASIVIARKTQTSTYSTALVTFQNKVLGTAPVTPYGGVTPRWFDYPNGSRIWLAGLDKSSRILSSEHDIIYVNQAEELSLDDWEILTTRTTGRAGNMPYSQTLGDMNPTYPAHWIYRRETLKLFYSQHRDNPMLYDPDTGELTSQGHLTMTVLQSLTGVRRTRLLDGLPAQAEGAIYDGYNHQVHLVPAFEIPDDWRRIRTVDFGFTSPFVCQWWAMDEDDRMYLYREIYMTQRTVRAHAELINELTGSQPIEATVCDTDAEDRATLEENGIPTVGADKRVTVGIEAVKARLEMAGDDKPLLFLMQGALVERDPILEERHLPLCTEDELPAYVWSNHATKDVPLKVNDHGCDPMRYGVMYLDYGGLSMVGLPQDNNTGTKWGMGEQEAPTWRLP